MQDFDLSIFFNTVVFLTFKRAEARAQLGSLISDIIQWMDQIFLLVLLVSNSNQIHSHNYQIDIVDKYSFLWYSRSVKQ